MKKSIWQTLGLLVVAAMLLTACGAPATEAPAATEAPTQAPTEAPAATEAPTATEAPAMPEVSFPCRLSQGQ